VCVWGGGGALGNPASGGRSTPVSGEPQYCNTHAVSRNGGSKRASGTQPYGPYRPAIWIGAWTVEGDDATPLAKQVLRHSRGGTQHHDRRGVPNATHDTQHAPHNSTLIDRCAASRVIASIPTNGPASPITRGFPRAPTDPPLRRVIAVAHNGRALYSMARGRASGQSLA
jgi:hypothetical protein